MNTANLQLQGLIMAVASVADALVQKEVLTHQDLSAALGEAEKRIGENNDRDLSDANRAATMFPIRVLMLANQASQRGRKFSFADYAELVGKLT
jgi:hypothetical protein